jgi:sigma-E factor negative regulatory protein RseB
MSQTRRKAVWLAPYAVVGALLSAPVLAVDDARQWLEKMNQALATRNYDGTFMHVSGGRSETMRIVHRVRGGKVTERLQSLDGSGREFVRNEGELTCYLPDQHTVLIEPRQEASPFLGNLPQFGSAAADFYEVESLQSTRVLNRPVRVIAVTPKDQYRFGYRLWLDEKTGMPLKTQLCDAQGQSIEQIIFAKLEMPDSIPDSDLAPSVHTEGMRLVRQGPSREPAMPGMATFKASELPPGFRLTIEGAQTLGGADVPTSHFVYSDGLATVSVFIEMPRTAGATSPTAPRPPAAAPMEGLSRVGSGYAYSSVVEGHQVTAVGEVPAQTVELLVHSIKSSGSPAPRR